MVRDGVKGKIVFVGSVLAYFSMVGYSTYSPGKFAIRGESQLIMNCVERCVKIHTRCIGLAEALQSEFMLYGIDVHMCFPGTILSPGFIEENKVKPKITLQLEETDVGMHPEEIAEHLLKGQCRFGHVALLPLRMAVGVEKGKFHITYDFIGNAFRASCRGSSPGSNGFMDQIYCIIGAVSVIRTLSLSRRLINHAR